MPKDMTDDDTLLRTTIVTRMRQRMREKGLNPAQVAEITGLNRRIVYDIFERKSMSPKISTLAAIARALGVSVAWLIGEVDHA